MPQLKHRNYVLEYDGPTTLELFEVRVITADLLEAERTAPSYGITPADAPLALNTMWLWAAARRMGHIGKVGWPEFQTRCLDWRPAEEAPEVDVPPTGASETGASASAPTASEASTSTDGSRSPRTRTKSNS